MTVKQYLTARNKLPRSPLLAAIYGGNLLRLGAGDIIKRAREAKGLSQKGLADLAGVSEKQVYNVEAGENTSVDFLAKIAPILGIRELPIDAGLTLTAPEIQLPDGFRVIDAAPRMRGMPIVAYVAAGHGGWEDTSGNDIVMIPEMLLGPNDFVVQARGESMRDEDIEDGDHLIVERRPSGIAAHGELVIAWLNDGLVIKRWYRRGGRKYLESANEELGWTPREITSSDVFEIQAVVRKIVKPATKKAKGAERRVSKHVPGLPGPVSGPRKVRDED
jgi:repressor LexA